MSDVFHGGGESLQGPIHALDDVPIVAAVLALIGADLQLPLGGRVGKLVGVDDHRIQAFHHADHGRHENIVFRPSAAVAGLLVGVQLAQVAVGDVGQRAGDVFDAGRHFVDRFSDCRENALVLPGDVGAVIVDRHALQHVVGLGETTQTVDARVEVVLQLVEVAVVGVGDLGRDVALGDAVHVLGRDVDRRHEGVNEAVGSFNDRPELQRNEIGVSARLQFAFHRRVREPLHFVGQDGDRLGNVSGDDDSDGEQRTASARWSRTSG